MNSPADNSNSLQPAAIPIVKWQICLLLLMASTLNYMDRMALNQSASDIKLRFNLSNEEYGQLEGAFSYAFAIGAFTCGWIVDRFGVFFVYPFVVALWSFSGFMTGYAPTFTILLICRFSLGLFEAGNWPCGIVTTKRVFPPEQRSLGNAFFQGGTALGAIITPIIILFCMGWFDPHLPQRDALFSLLGGAIGGVIPASSPAWAMPFQIIGTLGFAWVMFWFLTMRRSQLVPPMKTVELREPDARPWYYEVVGSRRFWILALFVMAINTTWHSFRVWLPLFLQKEHGYSREEMNYFSSLYYMAAELGSITIGIATLKLAGTRAGVHGSRMIAFLICALLGMLSILAAYLPKGTLLLGVLLVIGFASLGLFPTYFSFSQEVSVKHQGKLTGLLGAINGLYLAKLYPLQGKLIDASQNYSSAIMLAGVPPLIAWLAVRLFWNTRKKTI